MDERHGPEGSENLAKTRIDSPSTAPLPLFAYLALISLARPRAYASRGGRAVTGCRGCAERAAFFAENFPKKNRGFNFSGLGKTPDLLRSRLRVPVRETFTGMLGTSDFQKARDTATAWQEEESIAQATRSRVK
jgi:hypothetical protein